MTRVDFVETGQHIKACQWIQYEKGKTEIRIVPDAGFTDKDKDFVKQATWERCGHDNMELNVKLCELQELEYSKRGKFRLIINKTKTKRN